MSGAPQRTPPRGVPARGGAPGGAGGKPNAGVQRAAPPPNKSFFKRCCPNGALPNEGKQTAVGCCIIGYAIFCFVAAFTRGWYKVRYSPDMTVPTCSMPLWECSLAACKPEDTHTGYKGEGECSTQQFAQVMFLFASVYAICYLMFISGILVPGSVGKWMNFDFQECCTRSSECAPLGEKKVQCPEKLGAATLCPVAHGVMLCGTPFFMLIGLFTVMSQDRSEFEGMPGQGYGTVFWIALILALLMLLVACFTTKAEAGLQAGAKRALPPRPPPRNPPAGAGGAVQMPASAPNGFNYYNPPSTTPITVQTSQQLANAVAPGRNTTICATTQFNRIGVDAAWVPMPVDFRPLMGRP